MGALVELIKKIGIFMIAAQAVIHFAPAQKYEKYMKLIVGIMILLQLLTPIYRIFTGTELNWEELLLYGEEEISLNGPAEDILEEIAGSHSVAEAVVGSMEEEIKSRLNHEIADEDYRIVNVIVSMKALGDRDANGIRQYELDTVRVVVRQTFSGDSAADGGNGMGRIEKVQVPEINVSVGSQDAEDTAKEAGQAQKTLTQAQEYEMSAARERELEEKLRKRFCDILGMEEEQMEVSVYGAVEEAVR